MAVHIEHGTILRACVNYDKHAATNANVMALLFPLEQAEDSY